MGSIFGSFGVLLILLGSYLLNWYGKKTKGVTGGEWEVLLMLDGKGHLYQFNYYLGWLLIIIGSFCALMGNLWPYLLPQ